MSKLEYLWVGPEKHRMDNKIHVDEDENFEVDNVLASDNELTLATKCKLMCMKLLEGTFGTCENGMSAPEQTHYFLPEKWDAWSRSLAKVSTRGLSKRTKQIKQKMP